MSISVGIDIVEYARFRSAGRKYGGRFLRRIFTERELRALPRRDRTLHYALGFSFKEAVWKALPPAAQKKNYFQEIEILWTQGTPALAIANYRTGYRLFFRRVGGDVLTLAVLFR